MPELPEVQTIVNDLNKRVTGRRIVKIWLDWPKMIKFPSSKRKFINVVSGSKIENVQRRGKYIKFYLNDNKLMIVHLKMTGHFLINQTKEKNKFIHLIFYLDNDNTLAFSDVRKFGTVRADYANNVENMPEMRKLGPEPLTIKFKEFSAIFTKTSKKIKQALMDPQKIAGIGNIYSDEALWLAKINPFKPANFLTEKELKILLQKIKDVLNKSLEMRGTSARNYRDAAGKKGFYYENRLVYNRENELCLRSCGSRIKKTKMSGRSAHFCPECQ